MSSEREATHACLLSTLVFLSGGCSTTCGDMGLLGHRSMGGFKMLVSQPLQPKHPFGAPVWALGQPHISDSRLSWVVRGYVQTWQALTAAWVRSAVDFKVAQVGGPATMARLPAGRATTALTSGAVTTPRRVWRRTISRGPMVRKKASREQLEAAAVFLWLRVSPITLSPTSRAAAPFVATAAALLELVRCVGGSRLPSVQLQSRYREQFWLSTPAFCFVVL